MLATAQSPRCSVASSKSSRDLLWLASSWPSGSPTKWWSTCPERTYATVRATAAPQWTPSSTASHTRLGMSRRCSSQFSPRAWTYPATASTASRIPSSSASSSAQHTNMINGRNRYKTLNQND
jgi:hypothetical protein